MENASRTPAFDPLAELGVRKDELRKALLDAFTDRECVVLPNSPSAFDGCGVYAIYYYGDHPRYQPISNDRWHADLPIYVGKAVPSGTRKGGGQREPTREQKLANRLAEHRTTIEHAENLSLNEFRCRYLPLEPLWIRYTEQLLISTYGPWWNRFIEGFGLHDVGAGRAGSERSVWDELHPGRPWVEKRDLQSVADDPDDVWERLVAPEIERAKAERSYKDLDTLSRQPEYDSDAPAVGETSLFDFAESTEE